MSEQTFPKPERILILPFPILLLMGGFFVGAAFLLIPKEEELLNRFLEDNNAARAHDLVKNARQEEVIEKAAAWIQSIRERAGIYHAEQVSMESAVNPQETLRTFLGDGTCRPGEVPLPDLVFALRSAETPASEDLLEQLELAGAEKALDVSDWKTLEAALAEKALAEGKPSAAADLLLSACEPGGTVAGNWERVHLAVKSCRWSDRAEDAADLLAKFEPKLLPEDLVELQIEVLQEVGRNGEAFTTATRYIGTLDENALIPEKLMHSVEQAGLYSGQQETLIPVYRRHLAATVIGQMSWEEFLTASDEGIVGDGSDYSRYAKTFAQLCEWTDLQEEAFEHYGKLAVMGDPDATERCLDLYLGLARQMDMEDILGRTSDATSFEKKEIQRLHLQLMAGNGHYQIAVPAYQNWLSENPEDAECWLEFALIFDEMGEFERALATCENALQIHRNDIALRVHTAGLLQSRGRYEDSLALLREFTAEEHTPTTREDYELLSEAVGSWDDFNKAVRLSILATDKPKVEQFENLARSAELAGDIAGEIKALENGLRIHPKSKTLALNLASTLIDLGEYEAAVAALTTPELKDQLAAVCLLIDIGGNVENPELIFNHLGSAAHRRYNLPPSSLVALSEIYQLMGQGEAAAEIFEGMPIGPPQWEMLAELRYNQRRLEDAKRYQVMVTERSTDHAAWMFLGEILQEMGDAPGAEIAFKKSLSLLRSRIVSESRSVADR